MTVRRAIVARYLARLLTKLGLLVLLANSNFRWLADNPIAALWIIPNSECSGLPD
jgi:hypothetical protein